MSAPVPQFDVPLRVEGGDLAVVEQDSDQDVVNAVTVLLRHELGEHPTYDDFGRPDLTFSPGGVDLDTLRAVIERWEPRAEVLLERHPELLAQLADSVAVQVKNTQP